MFLYGQCDLTLCFGNQKGCDEPAIALAVCQLRLKAFKSDTGTHSQRRFGTYCVFLLGIVESLVREKIVYAYKCHFSCK